MSSNSQNVNETDEAWSRRLASEICHERKWPLLEPIRLRKGWFRWVITTNADSIGANVVITLNKRPPGRGFAEVYSRQCKPVGAVNMDTKQKALDLTRRALEMLALEEAKHRLGRPIVGAQTQLQSSGRQLEQMLEQLQSGTLPSPDKRLSGMGHMVGDSWPLNDPLGSALLEAEQAYKNAK